MTFTEYNILGQDITYSVYTFPIKPLAYTNIFLNPENFDRLLSHLREILSIGSGKPSINTFQANKSSKGYLSFGKMSMDGKNDSTWLNKYMATEGRNHYHTDFWVPQKTTAINNYSHKPIV